MKWLSVFFVMVIGSAIAIDDPWTDEKIDQIFAEATEVTIPVPEMVARNNYSIEVHHVMTKDGYILEIHRVPASPISPAAKGKPVIFLMHGILSSSADWIEMGPGRSFGYILADAGYDVWIGNARGNTYSRRHNTIATQKEFWNFSWHEIGIYDLPAMIDFALATTGQKKLFYIGHSQGTTTFFVLMSQRPSYNDKINAMFALAPVAYMGNLKSPALRLAALSTNSLTELYGLFGLYVWEPSPRWLRAVRATYCEKDTASQLLCTNSILLLSGFNKDHLNMSMLPIIYGHSPAGSAVRQLSHYGQEIQSHKFRQYDYGIVQNLLVYGSLTPPPYDMSLVTAPVHLVYSENDYLAAPVDVAQLYNELGNPVELWRIPDKNWAHVDYIWGIDSPSVVYFPIIEKIKKIYGAQT